MYQEQIKMFPFIINKVDNFSFIELNTVKDIEKIEIEINIKDYDS